MSKVNWLKVGLTILKYGITLVLGYLGGSGDISNVVSNL